MFRSTTPEKVISFIKGSVALTCCWPLPAAATNNQVHRFKIIRSILFLNASLLFFPLLFALRVHRYDDGNLSKAICLTMAVMQNLTQTVFCITQYDHFQRLIAEMEVCCKKAKSYERRVFQRYVNRYSTFYGMAAIWSYMTATVVVLGTLFTPDPFPTNAEYPFPVNFEPIRSVIFVHQALVGLQCAGHVCINIFCALLLLFTAARFDILMIKLRTVKDDETLIECIRNYCCVKRYAKEVIRTIRLIVLITVVFCGVATVFSAINLIGRQPLSVKTQFLSLSAVGLLEVFMCAWPASHLIDASENVMQGAYDSAWYKQTPRLQKSVLLMLTAQSPAVLRIQCIISALSLNYYCSFVTNVFSSFTALRVFMSTDKIEKFTP